MKSRSIAQANRWLLIFLLASQSSLLIAQELLPFQHAGQWGYQTQQGKPVIKPQYQFAKRFSGPYAIVASQHRMGVIDRNNRHVIPFAYDIIDYAGPDRLMAGFKDTYFGEYKVGIITAQNQVVIKPVFRSVTRKANQYQVQTTQDSLIQQGQFKGSRAVKSQYGLYNLNGKVVIPCRYDYIVWLDDSLIVLHLTNSQALYSVTGKPLTGFTYRVISEFHEGLARVVQGKLHGFIDRQGKVVIAPRFLLSEPFANGLAMVMLDTKWGAIDQKGQFVIDPAYSFDEVKARLAKRANK